MKCLDTKALKYNVILIMVTHQLYVAEGFTGHSKTDENKIINENKYRLESRTMPVGTDCASFLRLNPEHYRSVIIKT